MRCKNCGAEINSRQKFCMECGMPIAVYSGKSSDGVTYSGKKRQSKGKFQSGKTHSPIRIVIPVFILLTICLAAAVFFVWQGIHSQSYKTASSPTASMESTVPAEHGTTAEPTTIAGSEAPTTLPGESDPIAIAKQIAVSEYYRYTELEKANSFMSKAFANNIPLEGLYRQPGFYKGKEVYFGGFVRQTQYSDANPNKVELLFEVAGIDQTNNTIFVSYTLKQNDLRILEGDYLDIYGYANDLVTYESVIGVSVTIPVVSAEYIYCSSGKVGMAETAEMKTAKERISGTFLSGNGKTMRFPIEIDPNASYLYDATAYDGCIVVYYRPSDGWNAAFPHNFYRLVLFDDGSIVAFSPDDSAVEGVYSIDAGTYKLYTPCTSDKTETHDVKSAAADSQTSTRGYVLESSGGLNIRSGPGTDYEIIGRLEPNVYVEITEQQQIGDSLWGRIEQGWVCMDYIVVSNQSPISSLESAINLYCGNWGDSIGHRCMMNISYANGLFYIDINWGNSAFSTNTWTFAGAYDASTNEIIYYNGKSILFNSYEDGTTGETVQYTDGSGRFYISGNNLYWDDYKEGTGSRCVFEKTQ